VYDNVLYHARNIGRGKDYSPDWRNIRSRCVACSHNLRIPAIGEYEADAPSENRHLVAHGFAASAKALYTQYPKGLPF
jgi:hypothetical protein